MEDTNQKKKCECQCCTCQNTKTIKEIARKNAKKAKETEDLLKFLALGAWAFFR